ncbi:MAG: exodeoxyribonuclease VII small subunit [Caldicoprobacterales bacterium]|jgi:exodeoxyribonuclease VII small subunit|nr:exodeoxyribonuclease VII small subunit [Clostridiales bacterium]
MERTNSKNQVSTFEEAIKELELIVNALQEGEVPLDQSLKLYKQGITLLEFCSKKLTEAQGIVSFLSQSKTGELLESPLDTLETDKKELR